MLGSRLLLSTSALGALALAFPLHAGEITEFTESAGDGFVLVDEEEGTVEPGIFAVNGDLNNDDFESANGFSPRGVQTCLMASNPLFLTEGCGAPPGSGKRIKTRLQGNGPLDLGFSVSPTGGVSEYFTFGKTTNDTGARITGFSLVLGTGSGDDFERIDPTAPGFDDAMSVLFDTELQTVEAGDRSEGWPGVEVGDEVQNPLQRVFFPGGLFGDGGQEGEVGFFDPERAVFIFEDPDGNFVELEASELLGDGHLTRFGDALIPTSMIPDGMFWNDTPDPDDEDALIAWFDNRADGGNGAWVYGSTGLEDQDDIDARLQELADTLGVDVADLGYGQDGEVPDNIVALMEENELFGTDVIEDLANLNLNFSMDVGDIAGGEFTLRIVPDFAPIVQAAGTEFQFGVAGALDGAANIPYLNADGEFTPIVAEIEGLPTRADQQLALERSGYSFLGAFSGLAYAFGSDQIFALGRGGSAGDSGAMSASTRGGTDWALTDNTDAFLSITGSTGAQERTTNNIGYDFSSRTVSVGVETSIRDNFSAGVMLGFMDGETNINDGRGSLDADGFSVAGFGRMGFGDGGRVQAVAGYQSLSFESTRHVRFGTIDETAAGDTHGGLLFAGVDAEWMMNFRGLRFGPMASAELYSMSIDGFTETGAGAFNLQVGDQDGDIVVGRIGLRGAHEIVSANTTTRIYGHAAFASRSGDDITVTTAFNGGALPSMNTPVDGMDEEWLDVGAGVSMQLANGSMGGTRIGAEYRGAFSSNDYQNHRGRLFVEIAF